MMKQMNSSNNKYSVFIAAPFTQFTRNDGSFDEDAQTIIRSAIDVCAEFKINYYSAHEIEDWGRNLREPDEALKADIDAVSTSERVVIILLGKLSEGVLVELGVALAHAKEIKIFDGGIEKLRSYLFSKNPLSNLSIQRFDNGDDLKVELINYLRQVCQIQA